MFKAYKKYWMGYVDFTGKSKRFSQRKRDEN